MIILHFDLQPQFKYMNYVIYTSQKLLCGFNFAGRYIEMRMRLVHLSMRTEGIKAFSKRIRRCSVDERKRYENDECGHKSF